MKGENIMKVEVLKHGSAYFGQQCPECHGGFISVKDHITQGIEDPKSGIYVFECQSCGCKFQIDTEETAP
jgi:hypothetical protein